MGDFFWHLFNSPVSENPYVTEQSILIVLGLVGAVVWVFYRLFK